MATLQANLIWIGLPCAKCGDALRAGAKPFVRSTVTGTEGLAPWLDEIVPPKR